MKGRLALVGRDCGRGAQAESIMTTGEGGLQVYGLQVIVTGSTSELADSCYTGGGGSVVCDGGLSEGMDLNMSTSFPMAKSTLMGCNCFSCMCDRFMVGVVVRALSSGYLSMSICSDSSDAVLKSKAEANFLGCL